MKNIECHLNYLIDTFLGPIAKIIECEVEVLAITPGAFQIIIKAPVPDDLHKAHSVNLRFKSQDTLVGNVVHVQRLDDGGLELQIDV